jgi:hypothetical protein
VTLTELLANLGETERVNGSPNRFLYALVKRSKELRIRRRCPWFG